MDRNSKSGLMYRGGLAVVAGYGVAASWAFVLGSTLPLTAIEATMWATMSSFALYAAAAVWAFAAATTLRALMGLALATGLAGVVLVCALVL